MVFATHAAPEIAQEAIMHLREAVIVSDRQSLQAFVLEQHTKHVFKHVYAVREAVEDLLGCSVDALRSAAFEHPTLHPLFGLKRRKVRQSQEVLGLIVSALLHELLASLIVDDTSHAIGKRALLRIARCARSNGVALEHPPA